MRSANVYCSAISKYGCTSDCGTYAYAVGKGLHVAQPSDLILSKPFMAPLSYSVSHPECPWSRSHGAVMSTGSSGTVCPLEFSPELAVSAPGRPWKRLSVDRFSCTMMTTCWIFEYGVGVGPTDGVGAGVSVGPGTGVGFGGGVPGNGVGVPVPDGADVGIGPAIGGSPPDAPPPPPPQLANAAANRATAAKDDRFTARTIYLENTAFHPETATISRKVLEVVVDRDV